VKPFRTAHPSRGCKITYKNYRSYKATLRKDFRRACGYCDDTDVYCGGTNAFHIDHFRPLKHFANLECVYANLVYACSYCNIAKSDDWPCLGTDVSYSKGQGYVDPCDPSFLDHFERSDIGQITPKTDVGRYMFQQLKLGLRRHELIWLLRQLREKIAEVSKYCKEQKNRRSKEAVALMEKHLELTDEYFRYKELYEDCI
jgi:HNH endonuclease